MSEREDDRPHHAATVVTASDRSAAGTREDLSGPAVADLLLAAGFRVAREIVPDDRQVLAALLRRLADEGGQRLIVVTGGTGLGPRDVTPEATRDVIEREVPGLAEAMRAAGRASTPEGGPLPRDLRPAAATLIVESCRVHPSGATESLAGDPRTAAPRARSARRSRRSITGG
jgi:molybdopterin adenylyltransferase